MQSLKKLLSFSVVDTDYLVLDSENLCIKDFYFEEVMDIIKNKKIKYTIKNYINNPLELLIIDNCNKLINFNNNSYSFMDPYWYFERDIVLKLITELSQLHKNKIIFILKDIIFFEYQLYSTFCFKYNLKQKISTDEILIDEKILKNNLNSEKYNPSGHTYHYICSTIIDETLDDYIMLLNKLDERITRLHWMPDNFAKSIIDNTNTCIGTFHWD